MNLRAGALKKNTKYSHTLSWIMSYQHSTAELHDSLWNWFYHMVPQCILCFFSGFPCIFNTFNNLWVQIPFPSANSNFWNTWAVSNIWYLIFISLPGKYFFPPKYGYFFAKNVHFWGALFNLKIWVAEGLKIRSLSWQKRKRYSFLIGLNACFCNW